MKNRIGFITETKQPQNREEVTVSAATIVPVPSVVRVYFHDIEKSYSYYNDCFDLHRGDMVYVDGKLEGMAGHVTEVAHNFKIKLSDYQRVVGLADRNVRGEFHMAQSHFVTFGKDTLPYKKALSWYKPVAKEQDDVVVGFDNSSFSIGNLKDMGVSNAIGDRGFDYYDENRVKYICVDHGKGRAIVKGGKPYEIEFEYHDGEISHLVCSCFCSGHCKHEVAAMLQLRDLLNIMEKQYADLWHKTDYFAAVYKVELFKMAVDGMETGRFIL